MPLLMHIDFASAQASNIGSRFEKKWRSNTRSDLDSALKSFSESDLPTNAYIADEQYKDCTLTSKYIQQCVYTLMDYKYVDSSLSHCHDNYFQSFGCNR